MARRRGLEVLVLKTMPYAAALFLFGLRCSGAGGLVEFEIREEAKD
jgi:hypothetical protein